MSRHRAHALASVLVIAVLAGCATPPPAAAPAEATFDAAAAVAAIRLAGAADARELVINPVGNPQVSDLRQQAGALEAAGQLQQAAGALDAALALDPRNPALLQERAEVAILERELELALRLARQATRSGTGAGPQCRRHWETLVQLLPVVVAGEGVAAELEQARRQRDACTVAAVPRY